MTVATTASATTQQGNGATTAFPFAFEIPTGAIQVTLTLRADGSSAVLSPSTYSVTGLDDPDGGIVNYPLVGSPLASTYNITIERVVPYTQTSVFTGQGDFDPEALEEALDTIVMQVQQLKTLTDNAIAFPLGASETTVDELIEDILNGAANATAAAASAAAAAASAASIAALLPLSAANIGTDAVTSIKIIANAITPIKLATSSVPYAGIMLNGQLVATVAANAATFAIKTAAGTDPSATDPVYVAFRSPTVATGAIVLRTLTAALSLTLSAGSTLGFTNNIPGKLWLVIFDDSGTLRLGVINALSGVNIFPVGRWPVASSTAEGGAGAADSAHVFYTGTAVSAKSYAVVGFASYEAGLAVAGTWGIVPTRLHLYRAETPLPGMVVQEAETASVAAATGTTVIPSDDTIPQNAEGDQYLSQAITPISATSLLSIDVNLNAVSSFVGGSSVVLALFRDAVASAIAVSQIDNIVITVTKVCSLRHMMLAGTTSATTFNLRAGPSDAGTVTVNGAGGARLFGGVLSSFIRVKEIST